MFRLFSRRTDDEAGLVLAALYDVLVGRRILEIVRQPTSPARPYTVYTVRVK